MNIRNRVKEMRLVNPDEVAPNPRNWRSHPQAQRDAIRGILADVGIAGAVLAYESKRYSGLTLIDGHERMTVGVAFPALILDVSDEEADKLLATFDPISAMAETNATALDSLLRDVSTDNAALAQMLNDLATDAGLYIEPQRDLVEDEVPEPPADPITKPGDLWLLGDHRLLCGDSTKAEDVDRLMAGAKAKLCQTDPPYGIAYVSNAQSKGQATSHVEIENDELDGEKLQAFLEATIKAAVPWLVDNCAFYLWHPMLTQGTFFAAAAAADILIHRQIIWCKPSLVFGRGDYHWQHELCFYGWRKGHRPEFYGERNQTTLWHIGRETSKDHPTAKPVAIWEPPFRNHTKKGDVVYEPFTGSGSQLIAAEQLGRKCYGMEISPAYCDVIVKRWETLTGKKAIRQTIGEL